MELNNTNSKTPVVPEVNKENKRKLTAREIFTIAINLGSDAAIEAIKNDK